MIEFSRPLLLILIIPWLTISVLFYRRNRESLESLRGGISRRFIKKFSVYTGPSLLLHSIAVFLMGALLIFAASHPVTSGYAEAGIRQDRIIFMIDASLSMVAGDISRYADKKTVKNRKEEAVSIAKAIMDELPGYQFGLVSFSGIASYHSPPVADTRLIESYLDNFKLHVFQKMGTNFRVVLDSLIHLTEYSGNTGFQGVMISDGEAKEDENYDDQLITLKKKGIPVHTIAVGTKKGGGIDIYDPRDVLEGKSKPKTIKSTSTYMVEEHLEKIAESTGGKFIVMDKNPSAKKLVSALKNASGGRLEKGRKGKKEISHWFLIAFAVLFFTDVLVFDNYIFISDFTGKAINRILNRIKK